LDTWWVCLGRKIGLNDSIDVLLTAVGCPGGPSIVQSLRQDPSVRIVGTDMRADVPAKYLVDQFCQVPPGRNAAYIPAMLDIVRNEEIKVILPLATFELSNLALHKHVFESVNCSVCVSDERALDVANNRHLLYKTFENKAFIPDFDTFGNVGDLKEKMHRLGFPARKVVIKPFVSHGSIGLRVIDDDADLYEQLTKQKPTAVTIPSMMLDEIFGDREIENFLLTEYLPGREYGIDLLLDPVSHKTITGIVRDNGYVTLSSVDSGRIVEHNEMYEVGKYIAESLGLSYAINIDFKLDSKGEPKMLEINPRLPATSFLAVTAGLNLPLYSVYLALGRQFSFPSRRHNLKIYSYRGFIVTDSDSIVNRC
jgi:carbamoyl-phosphate synthase large subunit